MSPRVVTALFLVAVFSLGAVVLAARGGGERDSADAPGDRFQGAIIPKGVRAPDFRLTDQDGEPISMRALRGRPVIVTFLYTTCEESCPVQAQTIKGALDDLGRDVPAVAVAVDPPRDTAERARAFNLEQRVAGRIRWALGSREELRPVWEGFAIQPQLQDAEHQARFTLVDRRGFQRVGYPASLATSEALAHDIRLLAGEGS